MKGLLVFLFLIFTTLSYANERSPRLFDGFWKNASESFSKNLPWHLTAVAVTPVLVETGVDAQVHRSFKQTDVNWFLPAVSAGYLLPFISLPMYAEGMAEKNRRLMGAAVAVAQTSMITLSTVSILKSFTGREPPDAGSKESVQHQSEDFNFGFLNRGIYDGWPSGHMATITSIASSMIHYYPEQSWIKFAGFASMTYTMVMVSVEHRAQFHWFSDGVAGGLMGWAIGRTVGQNMRDMVNGTEKVEEKKTVEILPIMSPGRSGIQLVWYE